MTADDVAALVESAISKIPDAWLRNAFDSFRVPIQEQQRAWEHDKPSTIYSIWIIADLRERGVGVAYADGGWGSRGWPWGLIWINDNGGMSGDEGWYNTLDECLHDAGYLDRFEPWE